VNPKVDRLVAAARHATGDLYLISDANVRASVPALLEVLRLFEDESVGIVSTPFVAAGAATLGARIEALHLLTFVLTGSALAASADIPCVVGKSMAVRRDLLERAGGFEAFLGVLAEDQALGLAMQRLGFRVVLGSEVVENVVVNRPLARALARQVRWNKLRFSFSAPLYLGELLLNPLGLALFALASAAFMGTRGSVAVAGTAALLVALIRGLQALVLGRLTGARVGALDAALMPLKDVLQLGTQAAPLFSREVSWHGHRARLGPGTRLVPAPVS
jgi:ceramide glucosyltransferase